MYIVALTGGIGSGKTTVADLFAKKNITVIDADKLALYFTSANSPCTQQIIQKLGPEIVLENDTINRSKLREVIFSDNSKRKWLEDLLHPIIYKELMLQAQQAPSPYCIAIIPLLFETQQHKEFNRVLVVDTTEEIQINRTMYRDKTTLDIVQSILQIQISREKRLAAADDIVYNYGDLSDLIPQVARLHELYLSLSSYMRS